MTTLDKKFLVAFGLALFAGLLVFWHFYDRGDNYKPLSISDITNELIDKRLIDASDINDQEASITAEITDPKTKAIIQFIEIPEWSGTGGTRGFVVSSSADGESIKVLCEFFGSKKVLQDTLRIDNSVVIYDELYRQGACCYFSREIHINLIDPSKNMAPDFPDSIQDYVTRHKISADPLNLSESIGNYTLIDDDTTTLERQVSDSIGTIYPTETWQYNVQTKTYTEVK
ncbi:MAG TPA: hypothetical protein VI953_01175 [Candidatus Paceibacterota bacterium]